MPEPLIRSVFDQYTHIENRLTNALVQVLARDQRLTRAFVAFATERNLPKTRRLSLACQTTPGDPPITSEQLAEQRGVPDAWIFDEAEGWALVIESKVGAQLTSDQLRRHVATARRRGFRDSSLLAITADDVRPALLKQAYDGATVHWLPWTGVHEFLSTGARYSNPVARFLGGQFIEYLRSVEARGMAGNKALTTFTGIPFDEDHPFNEPEARVVVRALVRELRTRLASSQRLPVATSADKPLTGTWDVMRFSFAGNDPFTRHPHLTAWIWEDTGLGMTLPNGAQGSYWRALMRSTKGLLGETLREVARRIRPMRRQLGRGLNEPRLFFEVSQRHFHARRFEIQDGVLRFDVDTLLEGRGSGVKAAPGWLPAAIAALEQGRGANLQVQLDARFPFAKGSVSSQRGFIDIAVQTAEALEPFLDLLVGKSSS